MANILNVEISAQFIWSAGIQYAFVFAGTTDLYNAPPVNQVVSIGSPQDPTTMPYPTFPDLASATSYYQTALAATLLTSINTSIGSAYYTSTSISTVDPSIQMLAMMIENEIPTNVSQLVNDVPYVSLTSLNSTLGGYVTSTGLTATLGSYTTSSYLTSTLGSYATTASLSSYVTSSSLSTTLSSYVTSSSLSTTLSGYVTTSALSSYVTTSSLTSTLAGYATTSALSGKLNTPTGSANQWINGTGATVGAAYSTPTFSGATTATQLSSSRDSQVQYSFDATVNISLLSGQSITATLTYADNSGMSTNPIIVDASTTTNSGVLGLTQTNTLKLTGRVPAGKYRQVTFTSVGSPTLPSTIKAGQEVLL